jgi:hypothetical protein
LVHCSIELESSGARILNILLNTSLQHPNINLIGHGDFVTFFPCNNINNGGNETIYTNLATVAIMTSGRRGKIVDKGSLLARWSFLCIKINCNEPILTLFKSRIVFLLIAIALRMTEQSHKEAIDCLLAQIACFLLFQCLCSISVVVVE